MFLRAKKRPSKTVRNHRYWSLVENRRTRGGRVVQRQVLYLGEINDTQKAAWCNLHMRCSRRAKERRCRCLSIPDDRLGAGVRL